MDDFRIANDGNGWDIVVENGDLVGITGTEAVTQRVVYRLMTWLGESPYERAAGVPYIGGVFGTEPVYGIGAILLQVILDTEGVAGFDEPEPSLLLDERTLNVDVTIVTDDGQRVQIAQEITPL